VDYLKANKEGDLSNLISTWSPHALKSTLGPQLPPSLTIGDMLKAIDALVDIDLMGLDIMEEG